MIPAADNTQVESNLQGQKVDMSFAKGAEKHLMSLLTRMYSDPELAVIRELATNALDSHIMVGQTKPIEVTTPSLLSPYFRVKDYGVGLSVEDIHTLYSQYGASLKRDSNAVNGMLGIGCKAPLAYADQFTLTAVKDGVRIQVAISRDEDGGGGMTIVDTASTKDPNGVEVLVPARTGNQMANKAAELFRYWPEKSVLLNGAEPARFTGTVKISDKLFVTQGDRYNTQQSKIVMANVAYPAGDLLDLRELGIPYGYAVIAYVEPGAVDFAPSREALEFTRRTRERISLVALEVKKGIVQAIQDHIEAASTPQEAVCEVLKWKQLLGSNRPDAFKYGGRVLPTSLKRPDVVPGRVRGRLFITSNSDYRMGSASDVPVIDLEHFTNSVFVTGYDMGSFTATHKKKLRQWTEKQQFNDVVRYFVLVDFDLGTAKNYIDPKRIVKWETVHAEQLPKAQRLVSGRLPGSYDIVTTEGTGRSDGSPGTRSGVPGKDIDQNHPVYYYHGNISQGYRWAGNLTQLGVKHFTIVCLPENRLAKFRRENPNFKEVTVVIEDKFKNLSEDSKLALAMHEQGVTAIFQTLGGWGRKFADPDITKAIRLAKIDVSALVWRHAWVDNGSLDTSWSNPLDKYPLFDGSDLRYSGTQSPEYKNHVKAYLNWHYQMSQKKRP